VSRAGRFWGWAVGVAIGFALAAALLMPYEALGLATEAERWRAWLLTLWTGGVLCILFGISGLLGVVVPVGVREVVEAGSVTRAVEERRSSWRRGEGGFHGNFAWWLVATGALLVALYFVSWAVLKQ